MYHNQWAPKLAQLIVTLTQQQGGLGFPAGSAPSPSGAKVFFANSGTEANEGALKIARKVGKDRWAAATGGKPDDPSCTKTRIVCFQNSFHGRSMGALSVTSTEKYQAPFRPLIPGVDVGTLNDHQSLNKLINDDTCVVIVEPVQGEGGVTPADEAWLRALRKRCDETGAVLIYDEIQVGQIMRCTNVIDSLYSAVYLGLDHFGHTLSFRRTATPTLLQWQSLWRMDIPLVLCCCVTRLLPQ